MALILQSYTIERVREREKEYFHSFLLLQKIIITIKLEVQFHALV